MLYSSFFSLYAFFDTCNTRISVNTFSEQNNYRYIVPIHILALLPVTFRVWTRKVYIGIDNITKAVLLVRSYFIASRNKNFNSVTTLHAQTSAKEVESDYGFWNKTNAFATGIDTMYNLLDEMYTHRYKTYGLLCFRRENDTNWRTKTITIILNDHLINIASWKKHYTLMNSFWSVKINCGINS